MNILLASSLDSFFQLIGVLLIFVFVLAITWLTTRWMAGYQKAHTSNKNLQIVESIRITNNKFISIIKAGEVYLVVAVGKDEIHLLTKLSEDELGSLPNMEEKQETMLPENFQEIFRRMKNKFPKKQG